jgi:hypothetical protein
MVIRCHSLRHTNTLVGTVKLATAQLYRAHTKTLPRTHGKKKGNDKYANLAKNSYQSTVVKTKFDGVASKSGRVPHEYVYPQLKCSGDRVTKISQMRAVTVTSIKSMHLHVTNCDN